MNFKGNFDISTFHYLKYYHIYDINGTIHKQGVFVCCSASCNKNVRRWCMPSWNSNL